MDKLTRYRSIIEEVIKDYAHKPANGDIEAELVIDRERGRYLVVLVGWERGKRVEGILMHVDIIDGKFWIQNEGTDRAIALELVRAGVPHEDIVLGFQPPDVRQYTDFAVA